MGSYSNWVSRQRGKPIWLLAGGILLTTSFWGGYKYFYSPWAKRDKLREAEMYANELARLEKERRLRE